MIRSSFLPALSFLLSVFLPFPLCGKAEGRVADMLRKLEQASDSQIQAQLARFPDADANGDGILTRGEAVAYVRSMAGETDSGKERKPTLSNVSYGPYERNVLDFWNAEGQGPRPLAILIHGGGFTNGDKSKWASSPILARLLESGISCAAINYRFRKDAAIQDILRDAARAVQFLRSKAGEWNLDKTKFVGIGGSAGAGTALWLDTRDDLADPKAEDPVLHESSRLQACVLFSTQSTYNLPRWESYLGPFKPEWLRSPNELTEFYHFASRADLETPKGREVLHECDMLAWISSDDGPVYVSNNNTDRPPNTRGEYIHHPEHARQIQKACEAAGVQCMKGSQSADGVLPFIQEVLKLK